MPLIEEPLNIWKAAKQGLLSEVCRFVHEGLHVDAKNRGEVTPLHEAASSGHVDLVEWLLDHGASINARTAKQTGYPGAETPLYLAVGARKHKVAALLLRRGANPKLKSSDGTTALEMAAQAGDYALVELLVENGADLNPRGDGNPLLSALCARHIEIAKYLVSKGARFDGKRPPFGGSMLMMVAHSKWLAGVEYLLSLGADFAQRDDDGKTALHYGVLGFGSRRTETVESKSGRKVTVSEKPEDAIPVVARLLQAGIDVAVRDKQGFSALDYAKKLRAQNLVEMLSGPIVVMRKGAER